MAKEYSPRNGRKNDVKYTSKRRIYTKDGVREETIEHLYTDEEMERHQREADHYEELRPKYIFENNKFVKEVVVPLISFGLFIRTLTR